VLEFVNILKDYKIVALTENLYIYIYIYIYLYYKKYIHNGTIGREMLQLIAEAMDNSMADLGSCTS
jgi:hypothetical protein